MLGNVATSCSGFVDRTGGSGSKGVLGLVALGNLRSGGLRIVNGRLREVTGAREASKRCGRVNTVCNFPVGIIDRADFRDNLPFISGHFIIRGRCGCRCGGKRLTGSSPVTTTGGFLGTLQGVPDCVRRCSSEYGTLRGRVPRLRRVTNGA